MKQQQYTLLDSGNFAKLEQLGPYRIVRPAAQAVWQPFLPVKEWQAIAAKFTRGSKGEGSWHLIDKKLPSTWPLVIAGISMEIRLTDFGHIGIFPEHHVANTLEYTIRRFTHAGRQFKLLNLFAYTGALSLMAAQWGAAVVHLDASRKSVAWARHNAELNRLNDKPIRWIVDDVKKFVAKEVRRNALYDGIILDPPSFGRGTNNELWQIEDELLPLLKELGQLRSKDFAFMQLSCHTPGYTPLVLGNLLAELFPREELHADEMSVFEKSSGRPLPSGACCLYSLGGTP